jgi:glycosyltransferase involved in cell wall biosynthesis
MAVSQAGRDGVRGGTRCAVSGFAISSCRMGRLIARGKYLFEDGRKFYARGVSYGPFPPNSRGERYPEPERANADFAMMREMGVNVVRVYVAPPPWMLEAAIAHGLRLMVGIPWPFHMAFLDSRAMADDIRKSIRTGVTELREHRDAIFAYSIGNEIRADIARWHGPRAVSRFLAELYDIGKQADPEGLFTYSNYPTTEYLDLSFLDFVCFNVYLHREEDFRRYMTHLLAATGERPLVLSETGMDTIREGEEHQAQLLAWQARASFEVGLSGMIVFAFTDEWHTGGAEITDWAFGLTTKERRPKLAFNAVGEVFRGELPPPLERAPKTSVVVASYNAEATLPACIESLKAQRYPDYEIIVVDDGSSDGTSRVAEAAGVNIIHTPHRGLACARNTGVDAATGEIVAFLDADAHADADWLYHLVESITRREAGAAGGPNFAPAATDGAFDAAPGIPREVRGEGDHLLQLCGCNMAVRKSALAGVHGFDPSFTSAGDDVDLSWRLAERKEVLVHAPAAVVTHHRRASVGDYLRQQRGYGAGEGLLYKKYPLRAPDRVGLYGGASSWLSALLGGPRVYHGAFGRGLFQTVYAGADLPWLAELPQSIEWVVISVLLTVLFGSNELLGFVGSLGIVIWIATACLAAAVTEAGSRQLTFQDRVTLVLLNLTGPLVRSFECERVRFSMAPQAYDVKSIPFSSRGRIVFTRAGEAVDSAPILERVRAELFRYGVAVAVTDGFQAWDLNVVLPPALRVSLNTLRNRDGSVALAWRTNSDARRTIMAAIIVFIVLLAAGFAWSAALVTTAVLTAIALAPAILRLVRIPSLLWAAAATIAKEDGLTIVEDDGVKAA